MEERPIVLGVVGDSGAGKSTLTGGLIDAMGPEHVTRISADDYHRYGRREREQLGITPLHPDANDLNALARDLWRLRCGERVLKPVYDHRDGTFCQPGYVRPARFLIVEGLLSFHTAALRRLHDLRVFLAPREDLRRGWKVTRDCITRSYTPAAVLRELDRREGDAAQFVRPQRDYAHIVVSFGEMSSHAATDFDADVLLRDAVQHWELVPRLRAAGGLAMVMQCEGEVLVRIPGKIDRARAAALQEAVGVRTSGLDQSRIAEIGTFSVGTDLRRSDALALVQLIILNRLACARAAGGAYAESPDHSRRAPIGSELALPV